LLAQEPDSEISVVVCDIDHFKTFNDTYGHSTGDIILKEVAYILSTQTRESDVIRYGGEEFVIILRKVSSEQTETVCNRLREKVAEHRITLESDESVGVTLSIGYVHFDGLSAFEQPFDLFKAADRAMYTAKESGRNRVVSFSQIQDSNTHLASTG